MTVQLPARGSVEWTLIEHMTDVLTSGATKESVGTGEYQPGEWQRCESAIHMFESRWAYARGSPFWFLALFLAQRDEEQTKVRVEAEKVAQQAKKENKRGGKARRETTGQTSNANSGGVARSKKGVPANASSKHVEELGHAPDANADRNADGSEPGAVGNAASKGPRSVPGPEYKQLKLFG
jgi:hypothetical protein